MRDTPLKVKEIKFPYKPRSKEDRVWLRVWEYMNEKKVNELARKLGVSLCQTGLNLIQSAFKIEPVEVSYEQFKRIFVDLDSKITPVLLDGKYYLTDWQTWKNIIAVDWTDQKKYVREKFDCDNASFSFCSRVSWLFGLNSKGAVYGKVYNKKTKKFINYHYWVCIVTNDSDGVRRLYWYEPITDKWVQHEKGKEIIIGNWIYKPQIARFF